jgi:NADH dehydrogenase/NADH:ubiquinone oxidoreductase subunit G
LQDLVNELNIKTIPFEFRYRNLEVERYDPFFDRDYNLCILCGRCIRACGEIRHAHTLEFQHRGQDTLVGTAFDLPHLQSGCQFCGACVDVCPTGALRDRFGRYEKPADRAVKTTCTLCSIGCAINLNISDNKVTSSTPRNNAICVRGRFGIAPLVNHPKRVTRPIMKKDGHHVEVEWAQALEYVSHQLREHKGRTGILFTPQMMYAAIDKAYALADALGAQISAPVDLDGYSSDLKFSMSKGQAAFIFANTDMVSDFSPLLLELRKRFDGRAVFIIIGSMDHNLVQFADMVLNPTPGTEHALLKNLTGRKKRPLNCGIPAADIVDAKQMLGDREIYVVYNMENFPNPDLDKDVKKIPLHSQVNTAQIAKIGLDDTYASILRSKKIDCLYMMGTAPLLSRKYKTVIVQDCFPPDFDFDVFLPAAAFAEVNGSIIDIEGKKKRVRKAIPPPGKAQPDEWIINSLARVMKTKLRKPKKKKTLKRRRGSLHTKTSSSYPVRMIIQENTYGYRGIALSSMLKGFERLRHDRYVWMNEHTAKKHKLKEGMLANMISPHASHSLPVKIHPDVPDHTVLVYYHPSMGYFPYEPVRLECTKS